MDIEFEFDSHDLWQDLDNVPPRPVLVDNLLEKKMLTFLAGQGGVAKSLFAQSVAVMVSSGLEWAGWQPRVPAPVLIMNTEDNVDYQRRRMYAIAKTMGARPVQPITSLGADEPQLFCWDPKNQVPVETAAWSALKRAVQERKPGLLIIDPLVDATMLNENDNGQMNWAMLQLRKLAWDHDMAILLVHHARKGGDVDSQDSARGASAIVNKARGGLQMDHLPEDQKKRLRPQDVEDWRSFVVLANPKASHSSRQGQKILRIVTVAHQNGDEYPALQQPLIGIMPEDGSILDVISNRELRTSMRGPLDGRADHELAVHFQVDKDSIRKVLRRLENTGAIHREQVTTAGRNTREVYRVGRGNELSL
ncbi:MAG: AAA family ATPase [Pseudomonadota bacterium]